MNGRRLERCLQKWVGEWTKRKTVDRERDSYSEGQRATFRAIRTVDCTRKKMVHESRLVHSDVVEIQGE